MHRYRIEVRPNLQADWEVKGHRHAENSDQALKLAGDQGLFPTFWLGRAPLDDAPEFTLTVELGNATMSTPDDLAESLREIAGLVEDNETEAKIIDANGNTVGSWSVIYPAEDYQEGHRYTTEELELLPVSHQGQADDCHIDSGDVRVWLSRTGVDDGEPFENTVTVERLQGGAWVEVAKYDGDSDQDASEDVGAAI